MHKSIVKKVYYRKCVITECSETLQALVKKALSLTEASDRQEKLNEEEEVFRLINQHSSCRGMTCCQMLLVDPGASQPVMVYDNIEGGYKIDAVKTTELSNEELRRNSDFVNSMLYFGVKENELVIMPSQALTIRALEAYLVWLLGEKLKLISDESRLALLKSSSSRAEELIMVDPVKSIEIGSAIVKLDSASHNDTYIAKDQFNVGVDALKAMAGKYFSENWLKNITDEANLKARIIISYSRSTDECGRDLLNKLGTTLRNLDEADVKVTLQNGAVISGDDLNLSTKFLISKTERGLYVTSELYSQMANWLILLHHDKE